MSILPLDQVEQQVEQAFEGFEEYLQRVRRDVEILGGSRIAAAPVPPLERHFLLLGARSRLWFGPGVLMSRG